MVIKNISFPFRDFFVNLFGENIYLVGGAVRDFLLKGSLSRKIDTDLMVTGEDYGSLEKKLAPFGKTVTVGKSFAVIKFSLEGSGFDIAIPRRDKIKNPGSSSHKNFTVESGSHISLEEDLSRRDFTCNSIALRIKDGEIFDPFKGQDDIKNKIIKMTSPETFSDDPLRLLRAARFSSVLGFRIDNQIYEEAKNIDLGELSSERVAEEFIRMLTESEKPSAGITEYLKLTILKKLFPELYPMSLTIQDSEFHPEKDEYGHHTVLIHTAIALDIAKKISGIKKLNFEEELSLLLSVILHDSGKPAATDWVYKKGRLAVTSLYHDSLGVEISKKFLERLKIDTRNRFPVRDMVLRLVRNHHRIYDLYSNKDVVGFKAFSRLLRDMDGRDDLLILLDFADRRSRYPDYIKFDDLDEISEWYLSKKNEHKIDEKIIEPIILGRDLIKMGIKPGKKLGVYLEKLYNFQLDGKFSSKEEGLELFKKIINDNS